MKRILSTAAIGLSLFVSASALAGEGYVIRSASLRAGPDSSYPSVARIRAGTSVSIEGCVDGWSWCDVDTGNDRGWMAGRYLQEEYEGRRVLVPGYGVQIGIPIVSFVFGNYWDDHYRSRSWYGHRERWSHVRPRYSVAYGNEHRSEARSNDARRDGSRGTSETVYRPSGQSPPGPTAGAHDAYRERSTGRQAPQTEAVRQTQSPNRDHVAQRVPASASTSRGETQPRVVAERNAPANDAVRQGHDQPRVIAEHRVAAPNAAPQAAKQNAAHGRDSEQGQGKDKDKDKDKDRDQH